MIALIIPGEAPLTQSLTLLLCIGVAYLAVIGGLHSWMKTREKFEVQLVSRVHNFNMFVISVLSALGILYGVINNCLVRFTLCRTNILKKHNWNMEVLFCDSQLVEINKGPLYFWLYIFAVSKVYELIDTVIIVLRKVCSTLFKVSLG